MWGYLVLVFHYQLWPEFQPSVTVPSVSHSMHDTFDLPRAGGGSQVRELLGMQAFGELSPWRTLLLQLAQAFCPHTGVAGIATVCTLVGIANHFQMRVEMGPKRLCPLHGGRRGHAGGQVAPLSDISGLTCLPKRSQATPDAAPPAGEVLTICFRLACLPLPLRAKHSLHTRRSLHQASGRLHPNPKF